MTQPPSHEPPASDLQHHTVSQLLTLHSAVLTELRRRRVCRSANNPTGDFAEWLVTQGISSISLNPDSVIDTWRRLAR